MLRGIAELNHATYGSDVDQDEEYFRLRFDSAYARERAIVLVALSGDRPVGLQTYSPWPYARDGQTYASLQSGATVVHPDSRRRGLFSRLLGEGNEIAQQRSVDFFTGFPGPMSHRGLLKDGWSELSGMRWWVRPLRPLLVARQRRAPDVPDHPLEIGEPLSLASRPGTTRDGPGQIVMTNEPEFLRWRFPGRTSETYREFVHESGAHRVAFTLKLQTSHGVREAVIGSIRADVPDRRLWRAALAALAREARRDRELAMISFLLPDRRSPYTGLLLSAGYVPGATSVPFLVKAFSDDPAVLDPRSWHVSAEDIDTWVNAPDIRA
jgi:GNAT superfamily N-acetyltransferase